MIENTDDNSPTSPSPLGRDGVRSNTGSYFELYNIPVSFHPDQALVKAKFYELSRLYHPDRFAAGDPAAMAEPLRMAATNNEAYKTLKSPDATMAYVLKTHNLLEEEEKYTLPPAFLMEMMDLNEAVSDYEDMPDSESTRLMAIDSLAEQLQAWEAATAALTRRFDTGEQDEALLLQIKDMYFRKKYLLRIQGRLNAFAGI
jgi:molecular chaperone HscB